jgi:hypothetical protein
LVINLWANEPLKRRKFKPKPAAWYTQTVVTFSDPPNHHQIAAALPALK